MVAVLDHHPALVSPSHLRLVDARTRHTVEVKIIWRRRVVAVVVAVAMVWLTISTAVTLVSWAGGVGEPSIPASEVAVVHVVAPGDTIWSVAREYQPAGDVRPFVDRLVSLNGGSDLVAGQTLLVSP